MMVLCIVINLSRYESIRYESPLCVAAAAAAAAGFKTSAKGFVNILDKGYRITLAAINEGQTCLQPIFAKSDEQFTRNEMLHSACVAVLRSGNERGVKYMKTSWIIKRGIPNGNFSLVLLDDIWMAWGFQVNFMYDPVH